MTAGRARLAKAMVASCAALLLPETPSAALNVFALPEASAEVQAWSNQRDLLWVADQAAVLLLLVWLLFSGMGARICVGLNRITGGLRLTTAALLAGLYAFMASAVTLPLSALGQVLAAPLGLAEPGWAEWLFARVREAGTLMAASSLLGLATYWLFGRYGAVRPSAPPGKLARVAVPDAPPAPA